MDRSRGRVRLELSDGMALVTIDSPPANVLDAVLAARLRACLEGIDSATAGVMVIRSAVPGTFATRSDAAQPRDRSEFVAWLRTIRETIETLAASPVVSIAAIEGRALGGGLELALACTLRVAGRSAQFGLPDVKQGMIPGGGGTQRLPRLVGRANALDLLITGRLIGAEEARAMSLVDRLTEPGDAEVHAIALARRLARFSRPALAGITRCVDVAQSLPFADGLAVEADELVRLLE